ncbi:MAG: hypothetical protein ACI915_001781 [Gammaproteobacteria bacterium]|jgi:hypothetical protein
MTFVECDATQSTTILNYFVYVYPAHADWIRDNHELKRALDSQLSRTRRVIKEMQVSAAKESNNRQELALTEDLTIPIPSMGDYDSLKQCLASIFANQESSIRYRKVLFAR